MRLLTVKEIEKLWPQLKHEHNWNQLQHLTEILFDFELISKVILNLDFDPESQTNSIESILFLNNNDENIQPNINKILYIWNATNVLFNEFQISQQQLLLDIFYDLDIYYDTLIEEYDLTQKPMIPPIYIFEGKIN